MIEIRKSVIVPYSPDKMYKLVTDIPNYPQYLPWCTKTEIREQNESSITGAVYIEYLKIKTHFVTKNTNYPNEKIDVQLVEGPFKQLSGHWKFIPLGEKGCKVEFFLHYKFANHLLEKIIGPVFGFITKNIVDCFIKEAQKQYGTTNKN